MAISTGVPTPLRAFLHDAGLDVTAPSTARIFTNRNLAFEQIPVVGFDMDYTLAAYNQAQLEALSLSCTLNKLLAAGYPKVLGEVQADPNFAVRGLMVDKKYGNIIKMDRHGYVGRAYHGRRKLPRSERKSLYREQRLGTERARFVAVDTLFALPEVTLYAEVVELIDTQPSAWGDAGAPSYATAWDDVRAAIDRSHQDGSIKDRIKADLGRYFNLDETLGPTLHKFRASGKKLFLLTNSFYPYTNAVMSFLLPASERYPSWHDYFDWVIVGAKKPAFFTENAPFQQLSAQGDPLGEPVREPMPGRIYEGGNQLGLQSALGVHGDQVLYVGDHIYGDIVRSKKSSGWRTALVVEDLEHELQVRSDQRHIIEEIDHLANLRIALTDEITAVRYLVAVLARTKVDDLTARGIDPGEAAKMIEDTRIKVRERHEHLRRYEAETADTLQRRIDQLTAAFNPYWGSVFAARHDLSQFAAQVESYACLYTSRVTNFRFVSPVKFFHTPLRTMP
ncbi:MAG: HAD-IG family 5'-nucleotidase, partial [Nannocystaceae bacterium]